MEEAPADNQSLKLRWMKFKWLTMTIHTNQGGMLPDDATGHTQQCTKLYGNV
jgi:hypothetical protein